MTIRPYLLALFLLTTAASLRAQAIVDGFEDIAPHEFTLRLEASPVAYAGRYHFGDSEGESEMVLTVRGNVASGKLSHGVYDERRKQWKSKTITFKGRIVGGLLLAGSWSGVFVKRGDRIGIVMFDAPTDFARGNFGYKIESE